MPYFLYEMLYTNLSTPHIWCAIIPTLNILRIVYFMSAARVFFGGGQTSTNRRMIVGVSASPQKGESSWHRRIHLADEDDTQIPHLTDGPEP